MSDVETADNRNLANLLSPAFLLKEKIKKSLYVKSSDASSYEILDSLMTSEQDRQNCCQ